MSPSIFDGQWILIAIPVHCALFFEPPTIQIYTLLGAQLLIIIILNFILNTIELVTFNIEIDIHLFLARLIRIQTIISPPDYVFALVCCCVVVYYFKDTFVCCIVTNHPIPATCVLSSRYLRGYVFKFRTVLHSSPCSEQLHSLLNGIIHRIESASGFLCV